MTAALNIVKEAIINGDHATMPKDKMLELRDLLVLMDASTGKPDTARKRRAKKEP